MSIEQIMAERDRQRAHDCRKIGKFVEARKQEIRNNFEAFMALHEKERWYILWDAAGMPK